MEICKREIQYESNILYHELTRREGNFASVEANSRLA